MEGCSGNVKIFVYETADNCKMVWCISDELWLIGGLITLPVTCTYLLSSTCYLYALAQYNGYDGTT